MESGVSPANSVPLRLVVVERGSPPFEQVFAGRDGFAELLVVAQGIGESLPRLAQTTTLRLRRLESSGRRVAEAVIMVGPDSGEPALAARCQLARALLQHQLDAEAGELVFQAHAVTEPDARHELLALVGTLGTLLAAGSVGVRVRFGAPLLAAGLRPAPRIVKAKQDAPVALGRPDEPRSRPESDRDAGAGA